MSVSSVHKYHKSCFQPIWLFYGLFTTVWAKTFKISYLRDFSAQASQIVFWRHLTVLRLITTVWAKTSKMSYVREFSPQVSQIVFPAQLTVFTACNNIMNINFKNLISGSWINKYHKSCSQLIWPFYGFKELHAVKLQKSNISVSSEQKYHKSCSQLIWPF